MALARGKATGKIGSSTATLVLTAVFLVVFIALTGFMLNQAYRDAAQRAQDRAEGAAHVVAAHVQWLMEASFQALRRIDDTLGDSLEQPSAGDIGDMNAAISSLPGNVQAWLYDASGAPRLTNADTEQRRNAADRDYFQHAKAGQEFSISTLLVGRTTGSKMFTVSKRLERHGQFVGVALIVIPADTLEQFKSSLELGPESTVGLFRSDGMMVTRYPVPDVALDLSKYVLFTDYLQHTNSGTYDAVSPLDNVARVVGYRRVDGYPLVALASIAKSEGFEGFWTLVTTTLIVEIPGMAGLLVMAIWMARLLRRDERTRDELSKALGENQVLLREIHHRVKNNLQQVSSLVQLQPLPADAKLKLGNRIAAMASVHEHIYRSDQFESVQIEDYLPKLMVDLKDSYGADVAMDWTVTPMQVHRDNALPLGLIVNEVVTNAIKHGFSDGREGRIVLTLERDDEGLGLLTVRDNGQGFDPEAPASGMGSRLIRALSAQMGGSYEFAMDDGAVFRLHFPTQAVAAAAE